jgi:hypothetical protein
MFKGRDTLKAAHRFLGSNLLAAMILLTGCETNDGVPNYGQVRLTNESSGSIDLYLGEELGLTVPPGRKGRTRVGEGPQAISIRDESGKVLFEQVAVIPDNTFAEYIVAADGRVHATAGNIKYPDEVGSKEEQVKVENRAAFPVELYGNGQMLAFVPAGLNSTVDVPNLVLHVSIRKKNGRVLFEQTLDIPKNAVIRYVVTPDGSVIASGGEIDPNIYDEEDDPDYDWDYYDKRE